MSVLYLTCDLDNVVFTFTAEEKSTWQFSRLSNFHRDNGKDCFVLRQASEGSTTRWVLENQTGQPSVFGTPKYSGHGPPFRGSPSPPRGMWTVWGCPFILSDTMPQRDAIPSPFTFEVPFAKMHFHEEGRLGYLDIEVFNVGIEDEHLDEILLTLRKVLVNLAQRPEMVLLLRTDARAAPMPSMRHVRKFLAFIQKEVGTECVLVGRGSAIVLVPSTFLGTAVLRLVQLVQRMLPAPYPQAIVASMEEADAFLANIAKEYPAMAHPEEYPESPVDLRNEVERREVPENQVVSVLFEHNESADNAIFSYMGFPQGHEELEVDEDATWPTLTEQLNLKEAVKEATAGASYMYQGSVPVPPCSETVKYLVLGKALHVHPAQTEKLRKALACFAGGYKKRLPVANPPYNCRNVLKNSMQVDGHHQDRTCKEAHESGTGYRAAACWDYGASAAHRAQCVKSPIDLDASLAAGSGRDSEASLQFVMKAVNNVTVQATNYTLDALPNSFGVRAGMPNFGSVIVSGRNFLLHKLSVKPISSHSYGGKHHVAEIQVEGIMDGDGLRKLAEISGVHSGRHADTHRRLSTEGAQAGTQEYHRLILSFPLEAGAGNSLLDQLGLPVAKYRDLIAHGKKYTVEHVDLQAGLHQAMSGNWFWYRGGMTVPGCPDWGVRWIVFEKPLPISMAQLNYLDLKVSGMDSTRLDGPKLDAAAYKATVFLKNLPPLAVDKHTTCIDEEWNYDDPSCWAEKFPLCSEGQRQSPIQIHRSHIKTVGKDNFLAACSWRPVANLHVVNFGKGLAVPGEQLGYITMIGEDGFPQFWQVAQLQLKMPSEHFIDGHAYAAELQVVHRNEQTVTQNVNSEKSFPFVTTSFFFEIGDRESTLLKQLFLPGTLDPETYRVIPLSLDLMRHLGPALDGDFYYYYGSSTSPDCHEMNKWFIFDHAFSMSMDQFATFKAMFPSPGNNRPLQPLRSHQVVKNSFEDGEPNHFDFYLGRHAARNRFFAGEFYIAVPIIATLLLMFSIMSFILVRDWVATKRSFSSMAEMIGRSSGGSRV